MLKKFSYTLLLFLIPSVSQAQTLNVFFTNFAQFLNNTVIPFLLGIAFLFFVINAFRFFILGGANEESRDKAKALAIYSIFAFVLIIIFWGIINMFSQFLGLGGKNAPCPDYMSEKNAGCIENYYDGDYYDEVPLPDQWNPINNPGGQLPG